MLRSIDGGGTCKVVDLRATAGMNLDVKFFDDDNGHVCAATSSDVAQANAVMPRTADGGETWTEVYRSARPFENCWKMNFPAPDTGYATVQNFQHVKSQRVFIKTIDGGRTWSKLPIRDDAAVRESGIGFIHERTGWTGTTTTGFATTDGGASWSPTEMGRVVNKIRVLKSDGAIRAYAIGAGL